MQKSFLTSVARSAALLATTRVGTTVGVTGAEDDRGACTYTGAGTKVAGAAIVAAGW